MATGGPTRPTALGSAGYATAPASRLASFAAQRDLFLNLTRAGLTARYKTTALGFLWFLLTPLVLMVALSIVFQQVIRLDIPDYPLFALAGLLPWTYFQATLGSATPSLVRSATLIKRVRLTRSLIPMAEVAGGFVHFIVAIALFIGLAAALGRVPGPLLLLLPLLIAINIACLVGLALLLSALEVVYRDVEFLVSMGLRVLFYLSPIFYPLAFVPDEWRGLFLLNPVAGLVESYRAVLLPGTTFDATPLLIAAVSSAVCLVAGVVVFRRLDARFDDHV
jgi:lipopolysaccharide transport system permease protein